MQLFVNTGGPDVGKTMLIDYLKSKSFSIVPESARSIIEDQVYINGDDVVLKINIYMSN